ncbi:splicing factor, Prp19-binding domain-containing protein [Rhodocollybia butyracea]|uniref:Splicing factor, Prp19-binding domain-containing protein n=1 Tax=Rhodocollybia butyracea TaxID=206335 RepID=A0A9P5PNG5_9AGAR|nr:splicing factor, Prp19-binding domain-containing protein [Rhodocollybia butyracea]
MSSKPKQAPRLARPVARYWKGKAPKNVVEADSDSEEEEEPQLEDEGDVNIAGEQEFGQEDEDEEEDIPVNKNSIPKSKSMNIALRDVNISKEGKVIIAGREESGKTALEDEEDESEEDDTPKVKDEEEEVRFEYDSDSEEEKPQLQLRPVFVSKRNRETIAERDKIAQDTEEAIKRREMELEERRKQSHDMVAESIRRELAEKEKEEQVPDVDDTDGLDPAGEFEAWRLRELARIKKEKEEEIRREQEREEIERRRAMPEEQRMKEDLERAQKLRDEKPKGQQKFLQKYWHKGAFHQVCFHTEILKRHDFTEATESTVDVSLLPKVMQVKNFGKRSRTKYTHLLDQDTTVSTGGFGGTAPVKAGGKSTDAGGCFLCGGPHMKKELARIRRDRIMSRVIKVAVVGSGLAGLTTAYLLSASEKFEVHVFEKANSATLGMDSSSITLPAPGKGQAWRIDVPMRSFQGGYYKTLISLYKHLGIKFRKTDFTYSFSRLRPKDGDSSRKIPTEMIYNGNSGTAGLGMPSSTRNRKDAFSSSVILTAIAATYSYVIFTLMCLRLLILYLRLLFLSVPILRPRRVEEMTFRTWSQLAAPKGLFVRWTMLDLYWAEFIRDILVPLFSAVCTAPEDSIYDHPVEELLDYIWLTIGHHHFVAVNGVQEVVSKLVARVQHLHLASPLTEVHVDPEDSTKLFVHVSTSSGPQVYGGFHHIVFATQANRAVPLLESYMTSLPPNAKAERRAVDEQITCLRKFTYCTTLVVNHTDPSLLPDDTRDKRDLNLIYLDRTLPTNTASEEKGASSDAAKSPRCLPPSYTMATHVLTPPVGSHLPTVYQTTNPIIEPQESKILSMASLERAVLTVQSKQALEGLSVECGRRWWQSAGQGKNRLGPLQGARPRNVNKQTPGIWICGSFAYCGIPLLEGCVVSARDVVEQGIWANEGVRSHIPW